MTAAPVVAAVIVIALALAIMEAAQVYVGLTLLGNPVPWLEAVRLTTPSWVVLAVLIPPLVVFNERRAKASSGVADFAVHVGAAIAFTLLHLAGSAWLAELVLPGPIGFETHFYRLATVYFVPDLLTYAALVGIQAAIRQYRSERQREVRDAWVIAGLAESRLLALQGQLRPDFFFNTLNAVAGLIATGETRKGLDALAWLGLVMRASLDDPPSNDHAIVREAELLDGYLRIQQTRFPERFSANIDLGDATAGMRCPPLAMYEYVVSLAESGLARGYAVDVGLRAERRKRQATMRIRYSGVDLPGPDDRTLTVARGRLRDRVGRDVMHTFDVEPESREVIIHVPLTVKGGGSR